MYSSRLAPRKPGVPGSVPWGSFPEKPLARPPLDEGWDCKVEAAAEGPKAYDGGFVACPPSCARSALRSGATDTGAIVAATAMPDGATGLLGLSGSSGLGPLEDEVDCILNMLERDIPQTKARGSAAACGVRAPGAGTPTAERQTSPRRRQAARSPRSFATKAHVVPATAAAPPKTAAVPVRRTVAASPSRKQPASLPSRGDHRGSPAGKAEASAPRKGRAGLASQAVPLQKRPCSASQADAALRAENTRLHSELREAHAALEVYTQDAQDAKGERDRAFKEAVELEEYVRQLREQLQQTATQNQANEDRGAGMLRPTLERGTALSTASGHGAAGGGAGRSGEPVSSTTACGSDASSGSSSSVPCGSASEAGGQSTPVPSGGGSESCIGARSGAQEHASDCQHTWEFVVQGQLDGDVEGDASPSSSPRGAAVARKTSMCFPGNALDRVKAHGVAYACTRGTRLNASVPNQDDYFLAMCTCAGKGWVALYGVLDGHGPAGHLCAATVRGTLPELIFGDPNLLSNPDDALRRAFQKADETLLQQPFDVRTSGTTATVALLMEMRCGQDEPGSLWLHVAHTGDSRAILATRTGAAEGDFKVHELTRAHQPSDADERRRVTQQGGEIRALNHNSSAMRVYLPGHDRPGMAITRSFGDAAATDCGIISEPEVTSRRVQPGRDLMLVLGTDGLFEFCSDVEVVTPLLQEGASVEVLEGVCAESRRRWAMNSYNQTVDDTTAIAVSLL